MEGAATTGRPSVMTFTPQKHLRIVSPADGPVPDAMPYPVVAPTLQEPLRCWPVCQRVTGIVGHCQRVLVQAQDHIDIGHTRTAQRQSRRLQTSVHTS